VRIFRSAPHAQELSSEIDWYENSAGCAMCGGKKAATAFNDAVAPTTPSSELSRDLEV